MDTKEKKRTGTQSGSASRQGSGTTRRTAQTGTKTNQNQSKRARTAPKETPRQNKPSPERKRENAASAPDVVYTPAKPFNRSRLLLRLATVAAVVIALVFGISIFFKVDTITVSGAEKYTAWMVAEASGIQEGDNLLTLDKVRASGKITAALPYVKSVRIAIELPGTVHIEIEELEVVYSIRDEAANWWLITSDGRVVTRADSATAGGYPNILGVQLSNPADGEQSVAAESTDGENPNPETVTGADRLRTVLSILQYLEENTIIGQVASVDVTDLGDIELWYGQQYQVVLGNATELGYKISCMKSAIDELEDYHSGILDVSFTTRPDDVVYTPFS